MSKPVAIVMLLFVLGVVVSPLVDLPLTIVRSVDLFLALIATVCSFLEPIVIGSPVASGQTHRVTPADRDVLDVTLAYRC
jgi:hypothetical protein